MAHNTRLTPYRTPDVRAILNALAGGQPVAVVGLSNFGKSTLLRQLLEPTVAAVYHELTDRAALFVYVDCNRMLQLSAQGFYEAVLRAVQETLAEAHANRVAIAAQIETYYQRVVNAVNTFDLPLAFNDAIIALLEDQPDEDVILLLDEFDSVLTGLDERVFLNLRGLKDKFEERVNYITATLRPLTTIGTGDQVGEFLEMFAGHQYHLKPLSAADATELAAELFEQNNDHLEPHERAFILAQAGGHPGLLQAVSHVVMEIESGAPASYRAQALSVAGDVLENHRLVRAELNKLWKHLLPHEREAATLVATRGLGALTDAQRLELLTRGLLVEDRESQQFFARLFEHFARRQSLVQQAAPNGIRVDIDAGTVWVHGQMIEPLTDLEYRLLLLLYGRIDKICDKFQIVESVWGQEYLGDVDDARIEKLVSRLRAKLEPDPSNPRYLVTVRGRGYKLNHRGDAADAEHG